MAILLEEIVESIEVWLSQLRKLRSKQPYVDPNLDPVLLVPGVAGSVLMAVDENGRSERVWVRIFGADHKLRTKLWSRFDTSIGKTVSLDPKTSIMVPEDRFGLYAIDMLDPDMIIGRDCVYYFHDMIIEMINWGFQEGTTLFGFGYDFRQSNRFEETLKRLAEKLESVYTASGGKRINIISHSMGGLLIFEKYVKNWIAVAAPFRGAPGYVTSTFLNGMSFVEGWEQNFFISKWSMHQLLIECPSLYELMGCPNFQWEHSPALEIWREKHDSEGSCNVMLESYPPTDTISVFSEALSSNTVNYHGESIPLPFNLEILKWANETRRIMSRAKVPPTVKFYNIYGTSVETPHSVCYGSKDAPVSDLEQLPFVKATYICVDGDGTVPTESAKADGLDAEARVGMPGEHRGILCDQHLFRILKHWLKVGDPDPFYNPLNDYVILPTAFEIERHREKGCEVTSLKEEWEIISREQNDGNFMNMHDGKPLVSSIIVAQGGEKECKRGKAHATVTVHPPHEGKQHVELNAVSVTLDG
ncbi:Lecithin:cholesterol/phospholipid:diacylglycerol acyltransferase [Dillenia turbinata]|uniref:Lecithin:cholesterol/phospholipid:diacylglycerol acyltransferase n=1 Tax=Dillenia turbinata TaxID=194707 RepID=A0AAN8ZBP2_9MAGN